MGFRIIDSNHNFFPLPVDTLLVLDRKINAVKVRVLQDGGFNTNVVLKRLVKRLRYCFKVIVENVLVQYFDNDSEEI